MININKKNIARSLCLLFTLVSFISCKKFLDQEPLSDITPEKYLWEESQLGAYAVGRYGILPSHGNYSFGTFGIDGNTDNMIIPNLDNKYIPGQWRVDATGGAWNFSNIYQMNYFLETVIPRWQAGTITGVAENINHFIGEIYFLRAFEYFNKLQDLGDFPIVRNTFPDNSEVLVEVSKRLPRSEVARFILSDLDSAITLLKVTAPDGRKNRISKPVAQLMKSRVALFEGTWLKYFKGTAFVPGGPEWPGASQAYNANYQFPAGSIDAEIDYLLGQAMDAAREVASTVQLVENTGMIESLNNENPYFSMFSAQDMSGYSEVLLWREYNRSLVTHNVPVMSQAGNYAVGLTRGMVESFLMSNGLPIYAAGSGYAGDDYLSNVRANRDGRLHLFLKEPGQRNVLANLSMGTHATEIEPIPRIWESGWEQKYTTGYTIRKGLNYDAIYCNNGQGYTGSITFRAAEAYLNYIEACYERTGSLDGNARTYWQQIRERAGVDTDIDKTIAATNVNMETRDWGAYSAGQLIDATLYNIRRERKNELMAEGLRFMDLKRWRAMDQLINAPYHAEGFKLWGPMQSWYNANQLVYGATDNSAVVSDPQRSVYLLPLEIRSNTLSYEGMRWAMAHYLSPIAIQHFLITSADGTPASSVMYQNPGWPTTGGSPAIGY
ncbi:MAG TPA: RagB/SusD family nutrient uptake outer membrane protein [Pseudosphingobacterium sp.]|nr:RagB/SusD family nutrient uptake outer membrane protein [Pseudosphingobacterium sp.]